MRFCMAQSMLLLLPVRFSPIQFPTLAGSGKGHVQENQNIRVRQALPHILYVGVFLGDVTGAISQAGQSGNQGGFPGRAWSDDADQWHECTGRFVLFLSRCHAVND